MKMLPCSFSRELGSRGSSDIKRGGVEVWCFCDASWVNMASMSVGAAVNAVTDLGYDARLQCTRA